VAQLHERYDNDDDDVVVMVIMMMMITENITKCPVYNPPVWVNICWFFSFLSFCHPRVELEKQSIGTNINVTKRKERKA